MEIDYQIVIDFLVGSFGAFVIQLYRRSRIKKLKNDGDERIEEILNRTHYIVTMTAFGGVLAASFPISFMEARVFEKLFIGISYDPILAALYCLSLKVDWKALIRSLMKLSFKKEKNTSNDESNDQGEEDKEHYGNINIYNHYRQLKAPPKSKYGWREYLIAIFYFSKKS
ncbi:MAG: hypothetical protein R3F48_12610 [Candidatus Zixiibacteriota bacterium]